MAVGDLDGDGREDLFLYEAASGQWWRQLPQGRGFSETSGTWSAGWTLVGPPQDVRLAAALSVGGRGSVTGSQKSSWLRWGLISLLISQLGGGGDPG